jgi:NADPH:quinone reductase
MRPRGSAASGLNPLDIKIRAGQAGHAQHPLPLVLGIDLAGTVAALGDGVSGFAVGDKVNGMTGGTAQVKVVVDVDAGQQ